MPKRIYEQYVPDELVEIVFSNRGEDVWQPAVVVALEPPGVWVQTADGGRWFMTNTYRIRKKEATAGDADSVIIGGS